MLLKGHKRWFIHVLDNKWKKIYRMCLTRQEALYNMELLEKGDKLAGKYSVYRIVCIAVKPVSKKQLKLF